VLAEHKGDLDEATDLCRKSLAIDEEVGDIRHAGTMKGRLGEIALKSERVDEAKALFREALQVAHSLAERSRVARALENMACAAQAEGEPPRAARLFGAAAAIRREMGAPQTPLDAMTIEPYMTAARRELGRARWQREWAAGAAMDMEQAVEYALEEF
jgi:tetratricopeptide (TPR) repeat protein